MENPNGPLAVFKSLVQDFQEGKRDKHNLFEALETFDGFLAEWESGIEKIKNDPKQYAEGEVLREDAIEGLRLFGDAVQMVRDSVEAGEPLEPAVELAKEGHLLLAYAAQTTERNIAKLEDELG